MEPVLGVRKKCERYGEIKNTTTRMESDANKFSMFKCSLLIHIHSREIKLPFGRLSVLKIHSNTKIERQVIMNEQCSAR